MKTVGFVLFSLLFSVRAVASTACDLSMSPEYQQRLGSWLVSLNEDMSKAIDTLQNFQDHLKDAPLRREALRKFIEATNSIDLIVMKLDNRSRELEPLYNEISLATQFAGGLSQWEIQKFNPTSGALAKEMLEPMIKEFMAIGVRYVEAISAVDNRARPLARSYINDVDGSLERLKNISGVMKTLSVSLAKESDPEAKE